MHKHPFVYIGGVMRSGTTLLQELLTCPPHSYMFHEPWFGAGRFLNYNLARKQIMRGWGIDIDDMKKNSDCWHFVERLRGYIPQLGVKEIRHIEWRRYYEIGDLLFVLIGRDPRDIYLSCVDRLNRDDAWKPQYLPFSPGGLYKELLPAVEALVSMYFSGRNNAIKVKYETLCHDFRREFGRIKRFVASPMLEDQFGIPGNCLSEIDRGQPEVRLHAGSVTSLSVDKYLSANDQMRKDADAFLAFMSDYTPYCEFWGY